MKPGNFVLAVLLPVLLSACAGAAGPAGTAPAATPGTRCNAAGVQYAVGRQADAALENETRIRAGAKIVRTLRPDDMVTMEFNGERLNLAVDRSGKVIRINCG